MEIWNWFRSGLPVALLITSVVLGERFEATRRTLASIRSAAGGHEADISAPGHLALVWLVLAIYGTWVALCIARDAANGIRSRVAGRQATRAIALVWAVVAAWSIWYLLGAAAVWRDVAVVNTARSILHTVAVALFLLALTVSGVVAGDPRRAWHRASSLRLQVIVLTALLAAVLALPVTAEQATDVFRSWPDHLPQACLGVAAALLLGAAVRDSAARFLEPPGGASEAEAANPWLRWGAGAALIAGGVVVAVIANAPLGIVVIAAIAGLRVVTRRAPPPEPPPECRPPGPEPQLPSDAARAEELLDAALRSRWVLAIPAATTAIGIWPLGSVPVALLGLVGFLVWRPPPTLPQPTGNDNVRQLARMLACLPLVTIYVGLADAGIDAFLLAGSSNAGDQELAYMTFAVGLLLAVLVGYATRVPQALPWIDSIPSAWLAPIGVVGLVAVGVLPETWAALAAVALLVVAPVLAFGPEPATDASRSLVAVAGAWIGATLALYWQPVEVAHAFGMIAITMLGVGGAMAALHYVGDAAQRRTPRAPLNTFLPARIPVVSLLALWFALAFFTVPSSLHQARTLHGAAPSMSLDTAVGAWLAEQPSGKRATMLLVGASGGGAKAGFWTDLVLDCAFGARTPLDSSHPSAPDECKRDRDETQREARLRTLFLTSSVSGGSVGVYHFLSKLRDVERGTPWVNDSAGADALSPVVGWGLFHDAPAFMLGVPWMDPSRCTDDAVTCRWNADRAVIQEAAVAGIWDELTPPADELSATAPGSPDGAAKPDAPIAVFNGALDGSRGRLLMSPLDLSPPYDQSGGCLDSGHTDVPGALDAHDVLVSGTQLPLVTAALLSARFPGVEPPGRVGTSTEEELTKSGCPAHMPVPAVRVRDGGYVENSGLLTIVDLLPAIERAIEAAHAEVHVVVLSIDDDSAVLCPRPTLREAHGGLGITAQAGPDYLTRLARDKLNSGRFANVTYLRISPPPTVGTHAATGWEVSQAARDRQLVHSLQLRGGAPYRNLARLRGLLDGNDAPPICLGMN